MPTNSNRTAVGLVLESTIGTTPATPAIKAQRVTSAQFKFAIKTQIGKEIRPDRQIVDAIRVGSEPSATLGIEVSHAADFDWIEPAMFNHLTTRYPSAVNNGSGDVIVSVVLGPVVYTTNNGSVFAVGDLVAASGFTNSGNNGIFVGITGSTTNALEITNAAAVAETPQAGARLKKVGWQAASAGIAATATGLTGVTGITGLVKGDWIKIGGTAAASQFATAGDNGWARLSANQSGGTLTFDIFPSSSWAADVGTGKTIQVFVGEYARPGLTYFTYTFEEQFQDVQSGTEYHYYKGMVLSKVTLNAKAQDLLTGSLEYRGIESEIDTVRFAGATDVIAPSFGLMTGSAAGAKCFINGAAPTGLNVITATEVTIDNTLRTQIAVGSDAPIGIGVGRTDVKGKLSFYYGDQTVLDNLRNNIAVGLALISGSGDDTFGRQAILIDMPRIKFLDGDVTVPGVDTDRMWEPTFQATLSPTYGYNIHMAVYEGLLGT